MGTCCFLPCCTSQWPLLAGWMLLNLGMAHKQLEQLGHVTAAMVLVNAFQVCADVNFVLRIRA